jgi:hypothetical protein
VEVRQPKPPASVRRLVSPRGGFPVSLFPDPLQTEDGALWSSPGESGHLRNKDSLDQSPKRSRSGWAVCSCHDSSSAAGSVEPLLFEQEPRQPGAGYPGLCPSVDQHCL